MKLVVIKTVFTTVEAHLIKSKLESEGIPCALFDENMVGLHPFYDVSTGGIKIKVHEKNQQKAVEILNELATE